MVIIKNLTNVNRTVKKSRKIDGIVIHWVGAVSTAEQNAKYFKSQNRGASAHYFVDNDGIVQIVEDKDVAWHCGAKTYYHPTLRNSNTIGIEMCLSYKNTISERTIANTAALVKTKMKEYSIPADKVVRHYDVTHKLCPAPYINQGLWEDLKKELTGCGQAGYWTKPINPYKQPNGTVKQNALTKSIALESVKWMQWQLNQCGYDLQVDGKFGPATLSALKSFQKARGLEVDGKCGPKTKAELLK